MTKPNTCCFTGHHLLPAEEISEIEHCIEKQVQRLMEQKVFCFAAGGAIGFDTIAAQVILKLKQIYPEVKLILVLPCRNQSAKWKLEDKNKYEEILSNADQIIYTSEHYWKGCMQKRNRYLVDMSTYCIFYLTKAAGGTSYTVRLAQKSGLTMLSATEFD